MTGTPACRARAAMRAMRRAVITARLAKARPPGKSRGLMASTIKTAVVDFGNRVRVGGMAATVPNVVSAFQRGRQQPSTPCATMSGAGSDMARWVDRRPDVSHSASPSSFDGAYDGGESGGGGASADYGGGDSGGGVTRT